MAIFLLIGPSGSGKSTSAKIVSERGDQVSVFDLDKEIKARIEGNSVSEYLRQVGDQKFFEVSKRTIEEISSNDSLHTLIVVGAGSINYLQAHEWYLKQNLISLTGDPQKIYERGNRQKYHPNIEGFIETEFNNSRKYLYENSKYVIDVTQQAPEQVADSILQIMLGSKPRDAGNYS